MDFGKEIANPSALNGFPDKVPAAQKVENLVLMAGIVEDNMDSVIEAIANLSYEEVVQEPDVDMGGRNFLQIHWSIAVPTNSRISFAPNSHN
jgi:hypothetical protein